MLVPQVRAKITPWVRVVHSLGSGKKRPLGSGSMPLGFGQDYSPRPGACLLIKTLLIKRLRC
jgi:hypothetical protein